MGYGYTRWLEGSPLPGGTVCIFLDGDARTLHIFSETEPDERDWRLVRIVLEEFGITEIGEPAWMADIDVWEIPLPAARHDTASRQFC